MKEELDARLRPLFDAIQVARTWGVTHEQLAETFERAIGRTDFERFLKIRKNAKTVTGTIERRKPIPESWLTAAFGRQKGICLRCQLAMLWGSSDPPTIDHTLSLAQGGKTTKQNCRAVHKSCNSSKNANSLIRESKLGHGTVLHQLESGGIDEIESN